MGLVWLVPPDGTAPRGRAEVGCDVSFVRLAAQVRLSLL